MLENFAENYGVLFEDPGSIVEESLYRVDKDSGLLKKVAWAEEADVETCEISDPGRGTGGTVLRAAAFRDKARGFLSDPWEGEGGGRPLPLCACRWCAVRHRRRTFSWCEKRSCECFSFPVYARRRMGSLWAGQPDPVSRQRDRPSAGGEYLADGNGRSGAFPCFDRPGRVQFRCWQAGGV